MASSAPVQKTHIAHELLSRAHPPAKADELFLTKVLQKPLILRPSSPDPSSQDARAKRRRARLRKKEHALRKQKVRPMSAKEKRMVDIYEIPKEQRKFKIYEPLHMLWVGYMHEILGLEAGKDVYLTPQSAGPKLVSADFHGAEIEVVRSGCVGRVGCKGIVVRDTKFTFQVVTRNNKLITIPKKDSIIRFSIPSAIREPTTAADEVTNSGSQPSTAVAEPDTKGLVFELHGSQFQNRAIDRATRKFKQQRMDYL